MGSPVLPLYTIQAAWIPGHKPCVLLLLLLRSMQHTQFVAQPRQSTGRVPAVAGGADTGRENNALVQSILASLSKRLADDSNRTMLSGLLHSVRAPQLQSWASTAGMLLPPSTVHLPRHLLLFRHTPTRSAGPSRGVKAALILSNWSAASSKSWPSTGRFSR